MVGAAVVAILNIAFGLWVARLISKDPANVFKKRDKDGNVIDRKD
jgi:hypothetical protein